MLDDTQDMQLYEKKLLSFLKIPQKGMKIKFSDLKNDSQFCSNMVELSNEISKQVFSQGYFVVEPQKVITPWITIGFLLIFSGLFNLSFFSPFWPIAYHLGISFIISGFLFLIFALFMPKRTKKGNEVYWKILGFREYLTTVEKYRAQFYEKENIFEKYLPYAIIFDLVDKWTRAFLDIHQKPPQQQQAQEINLISLKNFSNLMTSSISPVYHSSKKSGFRGSAGRGRGGGGGGSW